MQWTRVACRKINTMGCLPEPGGRAMWQPYRSASITLERPKICSRRATDCAATVDNTTPNGSALQIDSQTVLQQSRHEGWPRQRLRQSKPLHLGRTSTRKALSALMQQSHLANNPSRENSAAHREGRGANEHGSEMEEQIYEEDLTSTGQLKSRSCAAKRARESSGLVRRQER